MNNKPLNKKSYSDEIVRLNQEIQKLKKTEEEYKKNEDGLKAEKDLLHDMASSHFAGVYRVVAFQSKAIKKENWHSSKGAPYVFEFLNDRFCEILKLDREVFEKNPSIINDLICEEDRADFIKINVEANTKRLPFLWEGRLKIHNEFIWVHFESIPRILKSGDTMWTGILYDITKEKENELLIKEQNAELQKINAEKDKFFSIIAHDLNNPLSYIHGFSSLLDEKIKQKDLEGIKKYAEQISISSLNALYLLNNLNDWAQSSMGRLKYLPEKIDLNTILNDSVKSFLSFADQKSILISLNTTSSLSVYADPAMINTVVRNLLMNAIKFTHSDGEIRISVKKEEDCITVCVKDTGIGMSAGYLEKLFQFGSSTSIPGTQDEKGTGLGLLLCHEFISLHKGRIWVESIKGKGSTFYFSIPITT